MLLKEWDMKDHLQVIYGGRRMWVSMNVLLVLQDCLCQITNIQVRVGIQHSGIIW